MNSPLLWLSEAGASNNYQGCVAGLLGRFFLDHDLDVRGDVLVQFHRDIEFSHRLERLMQLNLAAIDVETLLLESLGDVSRRDRSEQLIVLARAALERDRQSLELFRQF